MFERLRDSRSTALEAAAFFALTLALAATFYARHPVPYDSDTYFHLAIARLYAAEGFLDQLPWLRYSLLRDGFGDKELGFHVLLAPFASLSDPLVGSRWALALLSAALATTVGWLARTAIGPWGWAVALWLPWASTELSWRLVRLRPELLALLLILLALRAAALERYRWVGVWGLVFALCYTAVHAYVGLFGLIFLWLGWARRDWQWRLALYPCLGAGLGLLLHPNFPKNLEVWAVQNVQFFFHKGQLDVGTEIRPNTTDVTLLVNLGWMLGLALLWRASRRHGEVPKAARRQADLLGVAGVVFAALYLLMARFSIYAVPLLTLWLLWELAARGRRPSARVRLPGRRYLPAWLAVGLCLLVSLPEARRQLANFDQRTDPGPGGSRLADRQAFADALPAGARVIAPWGQTAIYSLWAPHGLYTNVLEPAFMAVPEPGAYRIQRAILDGTLTDIPLAAAEHLDSEYLALAIPRTAPLLTDRLAADPRIETLHRGSNWLLRFSPPPAASFVRDWRLLPADLAPPNGSGLDAYTLAPYPRHPQPELAQLEAYIDAQRVVPPGSCAAFARRLEVDQAVRIDYEIAPSGPTVMWLDGVQLIELRVGVDAVLGRGPHLELRLSPGSHWLEVLTCPAAGDPQSGFYLLAHGRTLAPPTDRPVEAGDPRHR